MIRQQSSIYGYQTSVYRKKTFTGLLTNYFSFARLNYKLGLVKTLLDRVYMINNSQLVFIWMLRSLFSYYGKTVFRLGQQDKIIQQQDKIIHGYLSNKLNPALTGQNASSNCGESSTHFYKLPHVDRFSKIAQTKLRQLLKRYCKADFIVRLNLETCSA